MSSLRLSEPREGLPDFIKRRAINACIACSDPTPNPTVVWDFCAEFKLLFSDLFFPEKEGFCSAGKGIVLPPDHVKEERFENQSHPDRAIICTLLFHRFVDDL